MAATWRGRCVTAAWEECGTGVRGVISACERRGRGASPSHQGRRVFCLNGGRGLVTEHSSV